MYRGQQSIKTPVPCPATLSSYVKGPPSFSPQSTKTGNEEDEGGLCEGGIARRLTRSDRKRHMSPQVFEPRQSGQSLDSVQ